MGVGAVEKMVKPEIWKRGSGKSANINFFRDLCYLVSAITVLSTPPTKINGQ
jgi:hypothetical protein